MPDCGTKLQAEVCTTCPLQGSLPGAYIPFSLSGVTECLTAFAQAKPSILTAAREPSS